MVVLFGQANLGQGGGLCGPGLDLPLGPTACGSCVHMYMSIDKLVLVFCAPYVLSS
jgi:hypothetical protein